MQFTKASEKLRDILLGYAHAIIFDMHNKHTLFVNVADLNLYRSLTWSELGCVFKQINQHLLQASLVPVYKLRQLTYNWIWQLTWLE